MNKLVTAFFLCVAIFAGVNLSHAQTQSIAPTAPTTHRSMVTPITNEHPGLVGHNSPLSAVELLSYFDNDSSHVYGDWTLPSPIMVNGNPYTIYSYSQRFTLDQVGKWYLDTVYVRLASNNFTTKSITVRALRQQIGTNGFPYPFGVTMDTGVIFRDSVQADDSFRTIAVAFHHKRVTVPAFFIQVEVPTDGSDSVFLFSDVMNNQSSTPNADFDTTVDRSYWIAREDAGGGGTGDTTYAGFQGGRFITNPDQFVIYPNYFIIAQFSDPTQNSVTTQLRGDHFELDQNYPNSVSGATTITYSLQNSGNAEIKLFSSIGEEVATIVNGPQSGGAHQATFDASKLTNGQYFYILRANGQTATRSMTVEH